MTDGEGTTSVSALLSSQMEMRKQKNASYSLRAFARDLGLSPSHLSEVLRGSEGLSEKKAEEVAKRLRLKQNDTRLLLDLILAEKGRTQVIRDRAKERIDKYQNLERKRRLKEDEFRFIADWYHAAIVELLVLKDFPRTTSAVAEYLRIPLAAADDALKRLERLRLVRLDSGGKWAPQNSTSVVFSEVPSAAIRKFHRQVLEKAIESVIHGKIDERSMSAAIVALPESAAAEMNERMKEMVLEICARYENSPKERLYAVAIQFFPVKGPK